MRLTIEGLGKRYRGGNWGLRGIDLELGPGVVGLLGPNGAGKSTLLRILATISKPTEGRVLWNGEDVVRSPEPLRRLLGYLPQDFGVYPNLTAREFLAYIAAAKGVPAAAARERIETLLDVVALRDDAARPLGGFSGGMRQRVGIAQALLADPRLLVVDEPTTGLDPEERVRFRNLLSDLSGERIVILSTHIVPDVESVSTDLVAIDHGRLIAHDRPEAWLAAVEGKVWQWLVPSEELPAVRERFRISGALRRAEGVEVRAVAESAPTPAARAVPPTLEDGYLWTVERARREGRAAA
ncbi:MAG: ABC transporter ATP-binding protein [Holophagales bacterium]|nr:ABC transporter ATP-binding protein [Holophagales bacterium]